MTPDEFLKSLNPPWMIKEFTPEHRPLVDGKGCVVSSQYEIAAQPLPELWALICRLATGQATPEEARALLAKVGVDVPPRETSPHRDNASGSASKPTAEEFLSFISGITSAKTYRAKWNLNGCDVSIDELGAFQLIADLAKTGRAEAQKFLEDAGVGMPVKLEPTMGETMSDSGSLSICLQLDGRSVFYREVKAIDPDIERQRDEAIQANIDLAAEQVELREQRDEAIRELAELKARRAPVGRCVDVVLEGPIQDARLIGIRDESGSMDAMPGDIHTEPDNPKRWFWRIPLAAPKSSEWIEVKVSPAPFRTADFLVELSDASGKRLDPNDFEQMPDGDSQAFRIPVAPNEGIEAMREALTNILKLVSEDPSASGIIVRNTCESALRMADASRPNDTIEPPIHGLVDGADPEVKKESTKDFMESVQSPSPTKAGAMTLPFIESPKNTITSDTGKQNEPTNQITGGNILFCWCGKSDCSVCAGRKPLTVADVERIADERLTARVRAAIVWLDKKRERIIRDDMPSKAAMLDCIGADIALLNLLLPKGGSNV